ncbi:MAG: response regulator [Betaproteobacteria bacterium]|nr:response regulator [Betaproteobacteria bacterium]
MNKRILIADDEPNIVTLLEFLMQQSGYDIRSASNGEDALRAVSEYHPHLVLLDVMMPLRNGYEVCQTMRESPEFDDVKIIMLTAKGREAEMAKGLASGADAYVTKPFATKELVETVKRLLEP